MTKRLTMESVQTELTELDPTLVLEVNTDWYVKPVYLIQLIPSDPALQFNSLGHVRRWIAADRAMGA